MSLSPGTKLGPYEIRGRLGVGGMGQGSLNQITKAQTAQLPLAILGAVLGNGAAGEINCYLEGLVATQTIHRAGEMNGFLKQTDSVLKEPIRTAGGKILLDPDFILELDPQKVDRYAVARLTFR